MGRWVVVGDLGAPFAVFVVDGVEGVCEVLLPAGWGAGSAVRWERAWRERSWATSSVLSFAAFTASVVGTMRREAANAPMASCSLEPVKVLVPLRLSPSTIVFQKLPHRLVEWMRPDRTVSHDQSACLREEHE